MARVPLRKYLREIDHLLEAGRPEQAVMHSLHILNYYPKHIETYRLLGRAYLESQKYVAAADIYQRVLSSLPDDAVAHTGMSLIREIQGNLVDATSHMLRAFEIQPGSPLLQQELRRLFVARDGAEPPRTHLTRGALARLYVRGELYVQAIAELNFVLRQEPERYDLQVLLAKCLVKTGQIVQAIQVCEKVIKNLPYCLDANLILAQLLDERVQAKELLTCRTKLLALEPYSAFLSSSKDTIESVPDEMVSILHLGEVEPENFTKVTPIESHILAKESKPPLQDIADTSELTLEPESPNQWEYEERGDVSEAVLESTAPYSPSQEPTELIRARQALEAQNVSEALSIYNHLVNTNLELESVVEDLQRAVLANPQEPEFWQIMGDACLRLDRNKDAMKAYTRAEELLS